jgi:hypothetical protein
MSNTIELTKLNYSVREACKAAGFSKAWLYNEWRHGRGPTRIKLGTRTLIPVEGFQTWLSENEIKPGPTGHKNLRLLATHRERGTDRNG